MSESTFNSKDIATIRFDGPVEKSRSEEYDGVDIRVYKISDPLKFLSNQKDLHRPTLKGNYQGEGLSNALNYLWDKWFKISRLTFQNIFSYFVRSKAVEHNANLHQSLPREQRTHFKPNPQFKRVAGYEVVEEFRYPFWKAKNIQPPSGTALAGSSSNFLNQKEGNVRIPLGKLKPGLYFVEAFIGTFRASTVVFVSDTVAVIKTSSSQELVWTAEKVSGKSKPGSKIMITDGVGILSQGETNSNGLYIFNRSQKTSETSEVTYVLGEDKEGGVFVSENFFYESEFSDTKMFIFTDRPLYNPGDLVQGKIFGKLKSQKISVSIIDSSGTIMVNKSVLLDQGQMGGEFQVTLPKDSVPGGYTIEALYDNKEYVASFRVANYVKPPFDVSIQFDKKNYKTNEVIKGNVAITYSNGRPVEDADVKLEIRKQKMTIVAGDLQYIDRFPIVHTSQEIKSDKSGRVSFSINTDDLPYRYLVTVIAKDGSSFKVAASKEVLANITEAPLSMSTQTKFTKAGDSLKINVSRNGTSSVGKGSWFWKAIRLQDRKTITGAVAADSESFSIKLTDSGNYTLLLQDESGRTLSSTSHVVTGKDFAQAIGTVNILFDKDEYNVGDTAKGSMIFSEPVEEALLTFERDKVEAASFLTLPDNSFKLEKISDREYLINVPVKSSYRPNIIFSVAFVKNGKYFFTNAGFKVAEPMIDLQFQFSKKSYAPGEVVDVTLKAMRNKKPVETVVSVGVVDEMIYTLQPEITPDISAFFHHPARNEIKTSSSLNFHTYDAASSAVGAAPSERQYERPLKLRERPRRDEKDTAFWKGSLKTNAEGIAKFNFVMPDSLTRWRVQARAFNSEGQTGSKKDYIYSEKLFYIKWSGPKNFRASDEASLPITVYNMTTTDKKIILKKEGSGIDLKDVELNLIPGPNFSSINFKAERGGTLKLSLWDGKNLIDRLDVDLKVSPNKWPSLETILWKKGMPVPKNIHGAKLTLVRGSGDAFFRVTDSLIDYPFGCVEQTSSRLLPLALAYNGIKQFGQSNFVQDKIENVLLQERARLVQLAGPNAQFSWWGDLTGVSSFVSIYAYYADFMVSQVLGLKVSKEHWENTLNIYQKFSDHESLHQKVLEVWMMGEMGLPVKNLTEGLLKEVSTLNTITIKDPMQAGTNDVEMASIFLLAKNLAQNNGLALPGHVETKIANLLKNKSVLESSIISTLLILNKKSITENDVQRSEEILNNLIDEQTTIERALTLAFLYKKTGSHFKQVTLAESFSPGKNWHSSQSDISRNRWTWTGGLTEAMELKIPENYSAHLVVEKFETQKSSLPVSLKRNLYRVSRNDEFMTASTAVTDGRVNSQDLYLDEIVITPTQNTKVNYGIVQVPLPPGALPEQATWGMTVQVDGKKITIDEKGTQVGTGYYSAAVPRLQAEIKIYQLIRFSTPGQYNLPGVKYFKMYKPDQQAFSSGDNQSVQKITVL